MKLVIFTGDFNNYDFRKKLFAIKNRFLKNFFEILSFELNVEHVIVDMV